jgi:hypothetical protein
MPLSGSSPYKCDGYEHHRVAFVGFVEERIEDPLAETDTVAVGQKHDAIGVQFVESVGELLNRAFNLGQT